MPRNNRPAHSSRDVARNRRKASAATDPDEGGFDITRVLDVGQRRVEIAGEVWMLRTVSQGRSTKTYICPGCNQNVAIGAAHVVAWLEEGAWGRSQGLDARRHWHSACWRSRSRA